MLYVLMFLAVVDVASYSWSFLSVRWLKGTKPRALVEVTLVVSPNAR